MWNWFFVLNTLSLSVPCSLSFTPWTQLYCFQIQLIPSVLPIPISFPMAHTSCAPAMPARPVGNGRVDLLAGIGPLCLTILKKSARELWCQQLPLLYLSLFFSPLLLRGNREGAVLPQNWMWTWLTPYALHSCMFSFSSPCAPVLCSYHCLVCMFYQHRYTPASIQLHLSTKIFFHFFKDL